jgi:hypothetical protein
MVLFRQQQGNWGEDAVDDKIVCAEEEEPFAGVLELSGHLI